MDEIHATHRAAPGPSQTYSDFDLWLGAKTALLGMGVVSPEQCHGASSLPFLLGKLEDMDHATFMKALCYLHDLHDLHDDISPQRVTLMVWYANESKNKYKYPQYRHLRPAKPKRKREPAPPLELTIPKPAHGCLYTDEELLHIISMYPKGSKERGDVRWLIIKNGFVKSKATFYRRIKMAGGDEAMKEKPQSASMALNPRSTGLGYEGDYIRPNIRHNVKWKGRIVFPMVAVSFRESEQMTAVDISHLANVDICTLIGNSDVVTTHEVEAWRRYNAQDPSRYDK